MREGVVTFKSKILRKVVQSQKASSKKAKSRIVGLRLKANEAKQETPPSVSPRFRTLKIVKPPLPSIEREDDKEESEVSGEWTDSDEAGSDAETDGRVYNEEDGTWSIPQGVADAYFGETGGIDGFSMELLNGMDEDLAPSSTSLNPPIDIHEQKHSLFRVRDTLKERSQELLRRVDQVSVILEVLSERTKEVMDYKYQSALERAETGGRLDPSPRPREFHYPQGYEGLKSVERYMQTPLDSDEPLPYIPPEPSLLEPLEQASSGSKRTKARSNQKKSRKPLVLIDVKSDLVAEYIQAMSRLRANLGAVTNHMEHLSRENRELMAKISKRNRAVGVSHQVVLRELARTRRNMMLGQSLVRPNLFLWGLTSISNNWNVSGAQSSVHNQNYVTESLHGPLYGRPIIEQRYKRKRRRAASQSETGHHQMFASQEE